jgi:hypothetical protein
VDPHPDNVLICPYKNGKPEMVLVDHGGSYKQLDDSFRVDYMQLWKSLSMANLKGIGSSCSRLGVTKMHPLFAAMLATRLYDEILEQQSKTGTFQAPSAKGAANSQVDKGVIRGYAKQFLSENFSFLGVLPRHMVLLLKMDDWISHIDMALDSTTNTSPIPW